MQKVARPTRTDKAHKLGYKAKQVMFDAIVTPVVSLLFSVMWSMSRVMLFFVWP